MWHPWINWRKLIVLEKETAFQERKTVHPGIRRINIYFGLLRIYWMPCKWIKNSCRGVHTNNLECFWLVSVGLYLSSANYRTIHFCTSPEVCASVWTGSTMATFGANAVTGQHLGSQKQWKELRPHVSLSCTQSVGTKKVRKAGAHHTAGPTAWAEQQWRQVVPPTQPDTWCLQHVLPGDKLLSSWTQWA